MKLMGAALIDDVDGMRQSLQRLIGETADNHELRWLWAVSQRELGDLLVKIRPDDAAQHVEDIISAYQAALQVYSRGLCPTEWAAVQNNLGNAYRMRQRGVTLRITTRWGYRPMKQPSPSGRATLTPMVGRELRIILATFTPGSRVATEP
jgi:hypothetical protein